MRSRWIIYLLFLLVGAGFTWGVLKIFELRFARGDVYPPYSSLRSDPVGAKIFYESLARLNGLRISRNEMALEQVSLPGNATFFYLGASDLIWTEKELLQVEKFVKNGGRLVITFYPQQEETSLVERKSTSEPSATPTPSPSEEAPLVKIFLLRELAKRWEFRLGANAKLIGAPVNGRIPEVDQESSWHSALHFQGSAPAWKVIYARSDFPVVIERPLGEGTIVLASDSYFASNEAARRERHPAFLAWLAGTNSEIIFDEVHHGVREVPGVSTLMRRYRLGGLIAGLVLLGLLACWKNAARFVPPRKTAPDEAVAGKGSFVGFINLLRRNIAPTELLGVCLTQWKKSLPRSAGLKEAKTKSVQSVIENFSEEKRLRRDPIHAYQEICRFIGEKRWKPTN
jgi:hypothetical protein